MRKLNRVEELWLNYLTKACPRGLDGNALRIVRTTFYAGASSAIEALLHNVEKDDDILSDMYAELIRFSQSNKIK